MDTTLFDFAAERLEHHTGFDRLEARGTLRIALKAGGVEVKSLTPTELRVVFEKVMPAELGTRDVGNVPDVCAAVLADLESAGDAVGDAGPTSADDVFRRLGDG